MEYVLAYDFGANGGGSLSDIWMQIMADVLQMPVTVVQDARHSGAIGAAFATAVGLVTRDQRGVK